MQHSCQQGQGSKFKQPMATLQKYLQAESLLVHWDVLYIHVSSHLRPGNFGKHMVMLKKKVQIPDLNKQKALMFIVAAQH